MFLLYCIHINNIYFIYINVHLKQISQFCENCRASQVGAQDLFMLTIIGLRCQCEKSPLYVKDQDLR